jgi:hypothetical protein
MKFISCSNGYQTVLCSITPSLQVTDGSDILKKKPHLTSPSPQIQDDKCFGKRLHSQLVTLLHLSAARLPRVPSPSVLTGTDAEPSPDVTHLQCHLHCFYVNQSSQSLQTDAYQLQSDFKRPVSSSSVIATAYHKYIYRNKKLTIPWQAAQQNVRSLCQAAEVINQGYMYPHRVSASKIFHTLSNTSQRNHKKQAAVLASCLTYSSTLKMEVTYSCKTSSFLQTMWHYYPQDCTLHCIYNA